MQVGTHGTETSRGNSTRSEAQRGVVEAFRTFPTFAGLLDIVPKRGGRIKLRLNRTQKAYCRVQTPRDVVLKSRQVGFTTGEQARDVYRLLTVPGARVVLTCQSMTDNPTARQLSSNYEAMFTGLERLGVRLDFRVRTTKEWALADRDATLRIVEAGASEAAAQKKGRGGTITRLHMTETALWEYAEETINAQLECVPAPELGSEIVSESTPKGAHGPFYQQCTEARRGTSGFRFHFLPWFLADDEYSVALGPGEVVEPQTDRQRVLVDRHGVTPEQLKWWQRKVGEKLGNEDLVNQEYPSDPDTCFLVSGNGLFDLAEVSAMLEACDPPVETRDRGRIRIWHRSDPSRRYVISADTAEGTGGDPSGAMVFEVGTGRHMATLHGQYIPWDLAAALVRLAREYNGATIAPERNNHGHAVIQALEREHKYQRLYRHHDGKVGWLTNEVSRAPMLDGLDAAVRRRTFDTDDRELLGQMRVFVVGRTGKAEAARGEHDDLVITAAIGLAVLRRPTTRYGFSSQDPV